MNLHTRSRKDILLALTGLDGLDPNNVKAGKGLAPSTSDTLPLKHCLKGSARGHAQPSSHAMPMLLSNIIQATGKCNAFAGAASVSLCPSGEITVPKLDFGLDS